MAKHNKRPIIFPLSNPSSCAEATPADIERWSDGRAIIGAGSPFPPIKRAGQPFSVDQSNNSYIFPGVGLGAIATHATVISDGMFMAAAKALAEMSPARSNPELNLLPRVTQLREVAIAVAIAVGKQAHAEGLTSGVDGVSKPPCAQDVDAALSAVPPRRGERLTAMDLARPASAWSCTSSWR